MVESFFSERFNRYADFRNIPDDPVLSNLSPWLHAGQISSQEVILMALSRYKKDNPNLKSLISEMFVWKETADHFCMHEPNYDNIQGALEWAQDTLKVHAKDKREKIYTLEELKSGKTYDDLWNAGQRELIKTGKMHGYVRMYWAKQLSKWTETPEKALEIAIFLNDEYAIDGNDPNGYLNIMWCLCGSMDRGFGERPICGKIRTMKSFKTLKYVQKWCSSTKTSKTK